MIEVENLYFRYKEEEVLDGVSLKISKNTTTAIIGPSGCGKTTLLYLLAGILSSEKGSVAIDGEKVTGIRSSSGIILQNYGLFPWKTVSENITLGLMARGYSKDSSNKRVYAILNELNIYNVKDKYPGQISGGQKQRAAIGRTLVLNPDILLMDEASSALDALTKENIQNLLLSIYKKRKTTMVFVTHSIEEAVFLGQNIVIMNAGKIKGIYQNPNVGIINHRISPEFHKGCTDVRSYLERI